MTNTLTILALAISIVSFLIYLKYPGRLGPFRQLQRAATFARAVVICIGKVAPVIAGKWRWYWPDAVREAKEGR
jgi:hypothetical protein